MNKGRILVIEDEQNIRHIIQTYLTAAGYEVLCVADGLTGRNAAEAFNPDLIVLDINLPGMNGLDLTEQLRRHSEICIVMLTARGAEEDRIRGLTLGADDYITKPFSPRELVARVEAVLRRTRSTSAENPPRLLRSRHLTIDSASHTATTPNGDLLLTTTEFRLLRHLLENPGRVLTRRQLLDHVWGNNFAGNDRVVDVYVGQVRRKLEAMLPDQPLISTVRGVGYRFEDERL
jgi:two-component system alkaline phosphatase synthesis response regulator PhoP